MAPRSPETRTPAGNAPEIEGSGGPGSADPVDLRVEPLVLECLAHGKSVEFEVGGASMSPWIRSHDVVIVQPTNDVEIGDVVVRTRGEDRLVVHRVIIIEGDKVITRGDAMTAPDEPVSRETVVGRVVAVVRDGRRHRSGLGYGRRFLAGLSRFGLLAPLARIVTRAAVRRAERPPKDRPGSEPRKPGPT